MIFSRSRSRPGSYQWVGHFFSVWFILGRRISLVSGEDRKPQFLFQRISVAIQRFNAVLLRDGFCLPTTRINAAPYFDFLHYFFLLREYTYRGSKNNNGSVIIILIIILKQKNTTAHGVSAIEFYYTQIAKLISDHEKLVTTENTERERERERERRKNRES